MSRLPLLEDEEDEALAQREKEYTNEMLDECEAQIRVLDRVQLSVSSCLAEKSDLVKAKRELVKAYWIVRRLQQQLRVKAALLIYPQPGVGLFAGKPEMRAWQAEDALDVSPASAWRDYLREPTEVAKLVRHLNEVRQPDSQAYSSEPANFK